MANILDYLRWRGDLDWRSSPLNDVDLLILAQLSYVNFDGQLSGEGRMDQRRSLAQTCAQLIEQDPQGRAVHQTSYLWAGNRQLLTLLSTCPRFSQMDMAGYHSVLDRQAQTQFGAVTYPLPRGGAVVAFRGTDDSLTGWQEDMALSYGDPAPAQRRAHLYLEKAAQAFPGALYLCGHSKGGNLAVYAAACAGPQVQRRIQRLCSFDGPGQ